VPASSLRWDEDKVNQEARYDGKRVLTTNTDLAPFEVTLKYKQLWRVEDVFRSVKSLLDTRPIFHKRDETIRGHVFCSFLALVLLEELEDRLAGWHSTAGYGDLDVLFQVLLRTPDSYIRLVWIEIVAESVVEPATESVMGTSSPSGAEAEVCTLVNSRKARRTAINEMATDMVSGSYSYGKSSLARFTRFGMCFHTAAELVDAFWPLCTPVARGQASPCCQPKSGSPY
jgi:hypothetical protein